MLSTLTSQPAYSLIGLGKLIPHGCVMNLRLSLPTTLAAASLPPNHHPLPPSPPPPQVGSLATASSIQEVALKSKQGQFVHSSLDRDASPNLSNYQDSYTALLDTALAGGLPNLTASGPGSSLLMSWSEWNAALVWASVDALTYPVVR